MFNLVPEKKAKVGRLIEVTTGQKAKVLESNKPFPVLQDLKKEYIQRGYMKSKLKITY